MGQSCCFAAAALASFVASAATPAPGAIIFDDFEVNEGHFDSAPTAAGGSNTNVASSSTAVRTTAEHFEPTGVGAERLTINAQSAGNFSRLRFLSGLGLQALNTPFTTSAGAADGFIGMAVKTTSPGWTIQVALDGPTPNDLQGSVERAVSADGQWHVYEWSLDDPASWGSVQPIGGDATFDDGQQSVDSLLFRNLSAPSSSTLHIDFLAKSDAGSIALMVPEPTSAAAFAAATTVGLLARRRRSAP